MIYILYVAYYLNSYNVPTSVEIEGRYETKQECLVAQSKFKSDVRTETRCAREDE